MSFRGVVDRYDRKRGFGHITPEAGGENLFIHWKNIVSSEEWPSLKKGMEVLYDTGIDSERRGEQKEVALNVTDLEGNPVVVQEEGTNKNLSRSVTTGTVKFFARKGFGFITADTPIKWPTKLPAGTDVYVSREDLVCQEGTICTLRPEHRVQFRVYADSTSEDGVKAGAVQNEDGTPLNFGDAAEASANRKDWVPKKGAGKKGYAGGKSKTAGKTGAGKGVTTSTAIVKKTVLAP